MKKILTAFGLFAITCAATYANDLFRANSFVYDKSTSPFSEYFDSSVKPLKTGEAMCTSYFHVVTKGDCSIKSAMEDGGIKKINSIDRRDKNILMYHKITLLVHGE